LSNKLSPSPEILRLELRPSRRLRAALLGIAVAALAAIGYSALAGYWRAFAVALLLTQFGVVLYRCMQPPGCLLWRAGRWLWIDARADEQILSLQHAVVWPGCILLRFRAQTTGKNHIFPLLHDSFDAALQRRLRLYLRHMPVFEADDR
jgi:Membrane-bound toxin component of toxin-antitoxin system